MPSLLVLTKRRNFSAVFYLHLEFLLNLYYYINIIF